MSQTFVAVQWNRRKYVYDACLVAGIAAYVSLFDAVSRAALTGEQAIFVAANHARQVLNFYHAYGPVSTIASLFTNDAMFTGASAPFQLFGAAALSVLFVMAATSHDFWQKLLGARAWKTLHMLVYAGYALVVANVAFGAVQFETSAWFTAAFAASIVLVGTLHGLAARHSTGVDRTGSGQVVTHDGSSWISAGPATLLGVDRAHRGTTPDGENLAVVRHGEQVSAVHGACAHQGGPLAEGRVRNGCLICPWHGWDYRPTDGQSPPPFTEKLHTQRVRLDARGHLLVEMAEFFVGYLPMSPRAARSSLAAGASIAAAVLLLGTVFAAFQRSPGGELQAAAYGVRHTGLLLPSPYPHLRTLNADGSFRTLRFTGWVKNNVGVPAKKVGQAVAVAVTGNQYERAGLRMLENGGDFAAASELSPADLARLTSVPSEDLGPVTLHGEIVDAKCYAGRMRPGVGHGHRACAQLCILGGIPPVRVTKGADGRQTHYVLASTQGERVNDAVAPFAAEPVEVRGRLERRGDLQVVHIDPSEIRRR